MVIDFGPEKIFLYKIFLFIVGVLQLKINILFSYHYILAITYTIALLLNYCITHNTYAYTYKSHMLYIVILSTVVP